MYFLVTIFFKQKNTSYNKILEKIFSNKRKYLLINEKSNFQTSGKVFQIFFNKDISYLFWFSGLLGIPFSYAKSKYNPMIWAFIK